MRKLFIKPLGSLANRLMGIVSAIRVAEYYDREPIVIWKAEPSCFAEWHDLFELDICDPTADVRDAESVRIDAGTLKFGVKPVLSLSNLERDVCVTTNCFIGHDEDDRGDSFWNFSKGVVDTSKYLERLRIVAKIRDCFEAFKTTYDFSNRLGLRIRKRLKNENLVAKGFLEISFEHYDRVLQQYFHQERSNLFVVSDDLEAIDFFKQKYGDFCVSYPARSSSENVSSDSIKSAFVNLLLLSETSKIIGLRGSSFAYFASLINLRPYTAVLSELVEKDSEYRTDFNQHRVKFIEHHYSFETFCYRYSRTYGSHLLSQESGRF